MTERHYNDKMAHGIREIAVHHQNDLTVRLVNNAETNASSAPMMA